MNSIVFFTTIVWGTVFPCLDEGVNPNNTCFMAGGLRWGIEEPIDRIIGTEVQVQFTFKGLEGEDNFDIDNVRIMN